MRGPTRTYGVVLKCRHKVTGQIVAIKKFKESDEDEQVKKTALREIKILKQLKHENIVSLLEVFRVKGKLYLVFEFVEKTILEEIEKNPEGLDPAHIKRLMWQLVRAIHFCHQHNIIHRDIKPENLLVSRNGVLKLCDFGFARPLAGPGAKYTEYVSTRWYRAPELLVGDVSYGKAVDVWSIGCMFAEITTGLPLFPGDSDIDQLYHIIKCLGHITPRHQELFKKNSLYVGVKLPHATEREPLDARFPHFDKHSLDFLQQTIKDEPLDRWTCAELLNHPFFENAGQQFEQELQDAIQRDLNDTMALRKKRLRSQKQSQPQQPPPPSRGSGRAPSSLDEYAVFPSSTTMPLTPSYTTSSYEAGGVKPSPPAAAAAANATVFKPVASVKDKHGMVAIGASPANKKLVPSGAGTAAASPAMTPTLLPTLASMTPSSSSTSTTSTASIESPSSSSPPHWPPHKKGHSVLPLPSDHHAELIQLHNAQQPRVSLTSHGGRYPQPQLQQPQPAYHPSQAMSPTAFHSFAPPPKPPPSSYGKATGSGHQTPTGGSGKPLRVFPASMSSTTAPVTGAGKAGKHGSTHGVASVVANSLQSSMEIYSPKKHGSPSPYQPHGNKRSVHQMAVAPLSTDVMPSPPSAASYVPPKTSHGSLRGVAAGTRQRRDHDRRS
ncbi:hypothetical protein P43SY_003502 [Pythium insidiosum]|uniref:Cyclin-dependent kinase 2 homolog n=1 Tax=Pythium insidiosum TaxID=114742 RepID=A0AAD5LZE4_PYTIN|nr:hypothetical protein P43SY_003502 [Pythium insidiosum]